MPCSWNDLFDDARNYSGAGWYETEFPIDPGWRGRRIHLRFGSAVYRARVWLNGHLLGEHVGGHLPFAFDLGPAARFDAPNRLVVSVENKLLLDRVPVDPRSEDVAVLAHAARSADGLRLLPLLRPAPPGAAVLDARRHVHDVTVKTSRSGATGLVNVDFTVNDGWSGHARLTFSGGRAADLRRGRRAGRRGQRDARACLGAGCGARTIPSSTGWTSRLAGERRSTSIR